MAEPIELDLTLNPLEPLLDLTNPAEAELMSEMELEVAKLVYQNPHMRNYLRVQASLAMRFMFPDGLEYADSKQVHVNVARVTGGIQAFKQLIALGDKYEELLIKSSQEKQQ